MLPVLISDPEVRERAAETFQSQEFKDNIEEYFVQNIKVGREKKSCPEEIAIASSSPSFLAKKNSGGRPTYPGTRAAKRSISGLSLPVFPGNPPLQSPFSWPLSPGVEKC